MFKYLIFTAIAFSTCAAFATGSNYNDGVVISRDAITGAETKVLPCGKIVFQSNTGSKTWTNSGPTQDAGLINSPHSNTRAADAPGG